MSKVAVVTGGNKGIGFGIVKGLCEQFDGTVYLTARDETRGRNAVDKLRKVGLNPVFHKLDLDDEESMKTFKKHLLETHGGIDILVNNAVIAFKVDIDRLIDDFIPPCQNDGDLSYKGQARKTIFTNYFGTKKVCQTLFSLLRENARVVNLTSDSGHLSRIAGKEPNAGKLREKFASENLSEEELDSLMLDFVTAAAEGLQFEQGWSNSPYEVSKVGISALTRIQQRQFDNEGRSDIVVNSVHPGFVATDVTDHRGPMTVEEGAAAAIYLSLLSESVPEELRGGYVWFDKTVVDWVNGPMPSAWLD